MRLLNSPAWTPDGKGFYYSRYDEPPPGEQYTKANYYQKLFYHRLGEPHGEAALRPGAASLRGGRGAGERGAVARPGPASSGARAAPGPAAQLIV